MVISLFEEMEDAHQHVACESDVSRELYKLFLSAKKSVYQRGRKW